ncbi:MAG: hypothetical protein M3Y07_03560 [Acidobacteriota bacterium]|nr:hypothetical protein [Acidobacteriota bacterium]
MSGRDRAESLYHRLRVHYQSARVRGQAYLTYRANLVNPPGQDFAQVTATLTSLDPFNIRVVPGQGIVTNANSPVDFSKLQRTFQTTRAGPIADAGPNQTVPAGSTVTLDGGGSKNLGGIGNPTYNWVFTSRPPGTSARLFFTTTATPFFIADVPGDYTLQLTAWNGVATNTASVTITAVPPSPSNTLSDDFSSGRNGSRWLVEGPRSSGSQGVLSFANQRVDATMGLGQGGAGIYRRCQLAGGFDLQVDFSLLNWPADNRHTAQFRAVELPSGPYGSPGPFRGFDLYGMVLPQNVFQQPTNDLSGKLRFTRVGSGSGGTAPTRIALEFGSSDANALGGVRVAFDTVKQNVGTLVCP